MTVRQTKRLVLVAGAVLMAAIAANLAVVLIRHNDVSDALHVLPEAFFLLLLASMWRRLGLMEATHGPDYVEPQPKYAKPVLIVASLVAIILAAVAAYLIATRR
jgi:hypothetical protein